jgi:hexosaminidase
MKKTILLTAAICFALLAVAQPGDMAIIPKPVSLSRTSDAFLLPVNPVIETSIHKDANRIATWLAAKIGTATGYKASVQAGITENSKTIKLVLVENTDKWVVGSEGYMLDVTVNGITIKAKEGAGLLYGVQTLLQLFPPDIESKTMIRAYNWQVPGVSIRDYPRFGWRGLMLDVARHFFTKQQVKDFIDNMIKYKYNLLHLHLTDDQGWRLEIKSLPKLTEVGAWRAERTGRWGEFTKPTPDEPKTYGGFYTQEDIKELIAYAADRFVTILPEIDIPGHSLAAVAAYPELSCTPGTYQVSSGDRFMIWPGDGTFYATLDNTLCPANEKVYEFIDKVMTEVAQLFPFKYIHMGGDECYKGFWEKSDACKQLMQKEGLKDMHELQSYFVKRVEKIIRSKGKQMMGWDEIMEGGLADGASVMSWRGMKGGAAAAATKHPVVMSPNDFTYVDLYQGDPVAEPPTYSMVRLSQSYKFDPLPPGADEKYILGGQANLWSERLFTVRHQQYMLWPRAFAVAESVWSPAGSKDWNSFTDRVDKHFERFDKAEINYSRSMFDPIFSVKRDARDSVQITLTTEISGLDIYYSFDEMFPDKFYPRYTQPLSVPRDAANLKVITYRKGVPVGKMINMPVAELRRRLGVKK